MPGDRLTHDERRTIGAGLSDGLGYGEIARRLNRPTSTVTREIARNDGPHGYRPDHAHHATAYRARRQRPTDRSATALGESRTDGLDPRAVAAFTERLADSMTSNGVPRMASRVLAHLYTTDQPSTTAAHLVHQLQVSPASISKAVNYLEELQMVQRTRDPLTRRDHYTIADDVWLRAWQTSAQANTSWADTAREGVELFTPETPAGARLAEMARFFTQLSADMSGTTPSPAAEDTATILAALLHAQRPLTAVALSEALAWPLARVTEALADAETYAPYTDPLALSRPTPTTYTVTAAAGRLTSAQRQALRAAD
ncbi:MarR family transcriptional regulator [Kribbella sp. NPDC051770]|uniref:GbsR/MarR family transcriptional regulator n=1 Tax=Kribbella sp. NPDC051770 TaxID=3155413 RepID=UPI003416A56E